MDAAVADLGLVALRQAQDHLVQRARRAASMMSPEAGSSSKREMFSATVPARISTSCGR
ncbi:MAG: hypothetical protein U1E87_05530 [Alphaproteobacteria bacterium]